jgi:hypothetical protein
MKPITLTLNEGEYFTVARALKEQEETEHRLAFGDLGPDAKAMFKGHHDTTVALVAKIEALAVEARKP